MKKALFLSLALILTLCLSVVALADQTIGTASATTGTVTINNATVGEAYQGYRIFNATVARTNGSDVSDIADDGSNGINYTWAGTGSMPTNSYFTEDAVGNITATAAADDGNGGLTDGAIALIKSWVGTDNSTYSFPTATASATTATDTTMVFQGLPYGYYYFTSTLGSIVTIDSTNPNATINDKNDVPTVEKEVKEDSNNTYGKQNDAEYGQTVEFQTTISAKAGAVGYVLVDKMDAGLTFDGLSSIAVALNGTAVASTNYTAALGGDYASTGDATFNIAFNQAFLDTLADGDEITVTYTATVANTAAIDTALANVTKLNYGAAQTTAEAETDTFVWGAKVVKYTGADAATGTKLAGAEFVIAQEVTANSAVTGYNLASFDANGKFTGWTFVAVADLATADLTSTSSADYATLGATVLTTPANGEINVTGLDEGAYLLIETQAPEGYNKLTATTALTITQTQAYNQITTPLSAGTNGVTEVDVQNNAGTVLPSTGGIGTTIIYVVGGLLVVGAIVLLITKKRMSTN